MTNNRDSRPLLYREKDKTANCPKCYQWHKLYIRRGAEKPELVVLHPSRGGRTLSAILMPYRDIQGLPEYTEKNDPYVFIKEGFKIIKTSEYMNPKLFD